MLTIHDIIDQSTGEVRRDVMWKLVVRRTGSKELRHLKSSVRYYRSIADQMIHDWRVRHGLPVVTVPTDIIGSD